MGSRKKPSTGLSPLEEQLRIQALRSVMLHAAIASRLGITVTDFTCLNLLSIENSQTPGQLAERLGITRGGAVTAMLDRLEAAGYVQRRRDEQDRRKVLVDLVDGIAHAVISPLFDDFGQDLERCLADYDDAQLEVLRELVERTNEIMRQVTAALRSPGE